MALPRVVLCPCLALRAAGVPTRSLWSVRVWGVHSLLMPTRARGQPCTGQQLLAVLAGAHRLAMLSRAGGQSWLSVQLQGPEAQWPWLARGSEAFLDRYLLHVQGSSALRASGHSGQWAGQKVSVPQGWVVVGMASGPVLGSGLSPVCCRRPAGHAPQRQVVLPVLWPPVFLTLAVDTVETC